MLPLTTAFGACFLCGEQLSTTDALFACAGMCCRLCHLDCANQKTKLTNACCEDCTKPGQMSTRDISVRFSMLFPAIIALQQQVEQLTGRIDRLTEDNTSLREQPKKKKPLEAVPAEEVTEVIQRRRSNPPGGKKSQNAVLSGRAKGNREVTAPTQASHIGGRDRRNHHHDDKNVQRSSNNEKASITDHKNNNNGELMRGSVQANAGGGDSSVAAAVALSCAGEGLVAKRVPQRKFFVSNLRPKLTAAEVAAHLGRLGTQPFIVYKLRTRTPSIYSSFCAVVQEKDFHQLCNPDKWTSKIVFKEYRGSPHPNQIVEKHQCANL